MKKTVFTVLLTIISFITLAQKTNPVSWTFNARKLTANKYEVKMTATLAKSWHIYSQKTPADGPFPTTFIFSQNALLIHTADPKEAGRLQRVKDKNIGVDVLYYSDQVDFIKNVTVKGKIKTNLSGKVKYCVCDENICLPPTEQSFSIALK